MNYDKSRVYTALNAEELHVGDKCLLADTKRDLDEQVEYFDTDRVRTLTDIRDDTYERRFVDEVKNAYAFACLVERKLQYRPYKNVNEMIEDWKSRFNGNVPDHAMPLIWVASKTSKSRYLVAAFYDGKDSGDDVLVGDDYLGLKDLFTDSTYLDGSPCGKKCEVTE